MKKVFDFRVDEDGMVVESVYDNVDDYYNEYMVNYNDLFFDELDYIDIENFEGDFDYKGSREEYNKFVMMVREFNEFLKENNDYMLISYSIEYDINWLIIRKEDWETLNKIVKFNENESL